MPTTPNGRGLGLNFAPRDPRNWAYPHAYTEPIPPGDIDLRERMQPVGDQGQLGSCTGWAGTAALEAKLGDGQQRSPLYVYYYDRLEDGTPASQDAGATMLGLCKALKNWGAPPESDWPYVIPNFDDRPPVAEVTRIDSYYQVQGSGMSLLQGLWAALQQGDTPLLALLIYPSFERIGRDGKVYMPSAGEQVLGGHAITACGWFNDNSAPGGLGWLMCQNSWSTGFGDAGYVYLPAGYFASGIVREGWVIAVSAPVPPPPPEPDVDYKEEIDARLGRIRDAVRAAQVARCPWNSTKAVYQQSMEQICTHEIGPIDDLARECQELLPKVNPPGPEPGPQFVSPFPTGAIYGKKKWLFGSLGCDGFCPRRTQIAAPADMVIEEVIRGQGINGGAEIIAATPDKSWAWRWRHVQAFPGITVGYRVPQGQAFAYVMDTSLDMLCPQPVGGFPDGWQHWDFSVNKGTDRFSPQGGGGGNYSAYQWLQEVGYQGTVMEKTPGPPSCGMSAEESIHLLTPEGRRK